MKISEVEVGMEVEHPSKGKGMVSRVTAKTITIVFTRSTVKVTYKTKDADFLISHFT